MIPIATCIILNPIVSEWLYASAPSVPRLASERPPAAATPDFSFRYGQPVSKLGSEGVTGTRNRIPVTECKKEDPRVTRA